MLAHVADRRSDVAIPRASGHQLFRDGEVVDATHLHQLVLLVDDGRVQQLQPLVDALRHLFRCRARL